MNSGKRKRHVDKFVDPISAKCYNKMIVKKNGNYELIELIVLQCNNESNKQPTKVSIFKKN